MCKRRRSYLPGIFFTPLQLHQLGWTLEEIVNGWLVFWVESRLCKCGPMLRTDTGTEGKRGAINQNLSQLPCSFQSCLFCFHTQSLRFFSSMTAATVCNYHRGCWGRTKQKLSNLFVFFVFCFVSFCFTWIISELVLGKNLVDNDGNKTVTALSYIPDQSV